MADNGNNGLTLMVVDDEPLTRQGFQLLLDWKTLGIGKLIEAANAQEAVNKASLFQPDIVVTDIRMPEMDGLALIERLKALLPETPVVIISGYSDFNYAKQAIKLGVTDYLVKPINQNELRKAIDHCLRRIQERDRQKQDSLVISCTSPAECFAHLLESTSEEVAKAISKKLARLGVVLDSLVFQIAMIQWPKQECPDLSRQPAVVRQDAQSGRLNVFLFQRTAIYCLVGAFSSGGLQMKTTLYHQLSCFDYKDQCMSVQVIGPVCDDISQIGIQARQCRKIARFKLFLNQPGTYQLSETPAHTEKQIYLNQESRRQLIHYITTHDQTSIHRLLRDLYTAYQTSVDLDPDIFYAAILEILVSIQRMMQEAGIHDCDRDCLNQVFLHRFAILSDLFDWLEKHVFSLSDRLHQHRSRRQPLVVIRQMQTAVLSQLDKNWRLDDFAAQHHYHPSYLSRLFKREEGISFSEYLVQVRIAEAQKRLISTSESIKRICHDIGYKDYHTFLSTFKDIVGRTPQAYRKEHLT